MVTDACDSKFVAIGFTRRPGHSMHAFMPNFSIPVALPDARSVWTVLHCHTSSQCSAPAFRASALGRRRARNPILMQSFSIVVMLRLEVVDGCDHSSACQSSL